MRVLLINPYTPRFVRHRDRSIPLGMLYIGAVLLKKGHEVKLIDTNNDIFALVEKKLDTGNYFKKDFWGKIGDFKPDLVGIGCLFSGKFKPALRIASLIKKRFPSCPIVMGGIHPTTFQREILSDYKLIDYIVIGEGEISFPLLIEAHFGRGKLEDIDGIAFRKGKDVIVNRKTQFIQNLDQLPFPAYELINLEEYYFDTSKWHNPKNLPINITIPIITSRGCPSRCTFCSMYLVHGRSYRIRAPKKVVDEIEYLYKKYNCKYFSFMDDNLTVLKDRIIAIANEIIHRKLDIQFDTPNGISVRTLDKEIIDAMVKAGLVRTCIAIESGSEYMRNKIMKKGLPTCKIYEFFKAVKEHRKQLQVKAFFIIGYPQENKQTLDDSLEMVEKIPIDFICVFFVIPFPGTELFEYCKENKLLNVPLDKLHKIDDFSDANDSDKPFIKPYELEMKELYEFREKLYDIVKKKGGYCE